ncbi:MAG: choice-of-anchor B family protein, partial [Rhodothermales bacterium]|nr:choice-of-anchor B family protein [Rhodothermales bacterium]
MKRPVLLLAFLILLALPTQAQQFGGAVAVGDGEVLVGETQNQITPGLVYVFRPGPDGTWQEAAQLTASDAPKDADRFGQALALDGATLLVGAGARDGSTGRAYVFTRTGDGWAEAARLTAPGLAEGDAFGSVLALDGATALVAAPGRDEQTGAVYVFERQADGTWAEAARLTGTDVQPGDRFGQALALHGATALIGAPAQNDAAGAAYVFERQADGTWAEAAHLTYDFLDGGDRFGSTVAFAGGRALVAAPRADRNTGAVLVLERGDDGAWTPQTRLGPFTATPNSRFGSSITAADGAVWIGAPGDNQRAGSVYALHYDAETGSWTGADKMTAEALSGRTSFGTAAAVAGGVAVVGATGADFGEGAAVLFEHTAGGWAERGVVINEPHGFASVTGGMVPCTDDDAAGFACRQVDLLAYLSVADLGGGRGVRVNDIWGWTDPQTGREYALVGRSDGTAFVDVSDAQNPFFVGDLPMTEGARASVWRDIKVYRDHAFIVSDGAGDHGMQVFDLTRLRGVGPAERPVTFGADVLYDQIASAHNIVINEETGFAYSVGSSGGGETCGGGLHMIDVREPQNPTFAGCFADPTTGRRKTGYSHDAQCVTYRGPDATYQGREICFGANETALSIADVTDKENPVPLSMATYPKVAYTHQGWLTDDQTYFYMNDEGDEPQGLVEGTRTLIWDV